MKYDPVRQGIRDLLWKRGLNMRGASLAIGRNPSYLHGFLERSSPKVLSYQDAEALSGLLGCKPDELRHAERPARRKGRGPKKPRHRRMEQGPAPFAGIPEVEVEASAGPGAFADEFISTRARWFLPEEMIRYEGGATAADIRVLRVRGESMEPDLSEGDRLIVDTARRVPAAGEMFVLWDGGGLVVKRVEPVPGGRDAPELRLKSANPDYSDYTCLAEDVHIVGKVLWSVRKV